MTNTSATLFSNETKEELLEQIQKGDSNAVKNFYSLFNTGELTFNTNSEDLFFVDLSSLSIEELIILNVHTKWDAPMYFLRKKCYGQWSSLSDDVLLVLLETLSPNAKKHLFENFKDKLESATDELLVLMAQEEFENSLDVLFVRYHPFVKNTIRKMKSKAIFVIGYDNDDLVQEGILGLYKSKNDYKINRGTKFKEFSRIVIEKHIGTLVKKSTNLKNSSLNESLSFHSPIGSDPDETFEQLLKSDKNSPDTVSCNKDIFYKIKGLFTELEDDVLDLYDKGFSYEEIGTMVNKNRKAIDNTIQRIRKKGKRFKTKFIDSANITESDITKSNVEINNKLAMLSRFLEQFANIKISEKELKKQEVFENALCALYKTEISYDLLLFLSNMELEKFEALIRNKKMSPDTPSKKISFTESYTF